MNEIYVILPSNGSTDKHPENKSNHYTNTWENALDFSKGSWLVGLTEIVYNHTQVTLNEDFSIQYSKILNFSTDVEFKLVVVDDKITGAFKFLSINVQNPLTVSIKQKRIRISSSYKFEINFGKNAENAGFTSKSYKAIFKNGKYVVTAETDIQYTTVLYEDVNKKFIRNVIRLNQYTYSNISTTFYSDHDVHGRMSFNADEYMHKPELAVEALNKRFGQVLKVDKGSGDDDRLQITLPKTTTRLEMRHGLNFMLGFSRIVFRNDSLEEVSFKANHPPQMKRGVNNMHIYANVCRPIYVGDVMAPLLKSLWLDINKRNYGLGEVRSIIVQNPMYVPVNINLTNSVEISIRTDSGKLFPFIEGAVTCVTLHFKRVL